MAYPCFIGPVLPRLGFNILDSLVYIVLLLVAGAVEGANTIEAHAARARRGVTGEKINHDTIRISMQHYVAETESLVPVGNSLFFNKMLRVSCVIRWVCNCCSEMGVARVIRHRMFVQAVSP